MTNSHTLKGQQGTYCTIDPITDNGTGCVCEAHKEHDKQFQVFIKGSSNWNSEREKYNNALRYERTILQELAKSGAVSQVPRFIDECQHSHSKFGSFIVLEYLRGNKLSTYTSTPQDPQQVMEWVIELLTVLEQVHGKKIFHQDIKPANLYFRNADDTKLCLIDFGCARSDNPEISDQHRLENAHTPPYAAPEQEQKPTHEEIQPRAIDIYAVGATMFHLLTGKAPPKASERVGRAIADDMADLRRPMEEANVYPALIKIVLKAMMIDPTKRFQSAGSMRVRLNEIREASTFHGKKISSKKNPNTRHCTIETTLGARNDDRRRWFSSAVYLATCSDKPDEQRVLVRVAAKQDGNISNVNRRVGIIGDREDNLPKRYEIIPEQDFTWIVTSFIGGETLQTKLNNNQHIHFETAYGWMQQLLTVVEALHRGGVFVGCIEPRNIKINDNKLYLIDLGLARRDSKTSDTEYITTLQQAVPEEWEIAQRYMSKAYKGGSMYTAASDLYSAGAVMWHVFTNESPEPADRWSDKPSVPDHIKNVTTRQILKQVVWPLLTLRGNEKPSKSAGDVQEHMAAVKNEDLEGKPWKRRLFYLKIYLKKSWITTWLIGVLIFPWNLAWNLAGDVVANVIGNLVTDTMVSDPTPTVEAEPGVVLPPPIIESSATPSATTAPSATPSATTAPSATPSATTAPSATPSATTALPTFSSFSPLVVEVPHDRVTQVDPVDFTINGTNLDRIERIYLVSADEPPARRRLEIRMQSAEQLVVRIRPSDLPGYANNEPIGEATYQLQGTVQNSANEWETPTFSIRDYKRSATVSGVREAYYETTDRIDSEFNADGIWRYFTQTYTEPGGDTLSRERLYQGDEVHILEEREADDGQTWYRLRRADEPDYPMIGWVEQWLVTNNDVPFDQ